MTKNDLQILATLGQQKCFDEIHSITASRISDLTGLSKTKVRITLNLLKALKYVDNGMIDGHSQSFYITDLGIKFIREVKH